MDSSFQSADSWKDAEALLTFRPLVPPETAGHPLGGLRLFVRDHRQRPLPVEQRTLEAHYGAFVLTQSRPGAREARRQALETSYGSCGFEAKIVGRDGRAYELGPEVPPDDIDGRMPAVLTWHDGDQFYLLASGEMHVDVLIRIATAMYA